MGELPFRAEISSEGGEPISMKVSEATVIGPNGARQVFLDEIELSIQKDKPGKAIFEVPTQPERKGTSITVGEANVTNSTDIYEVVVDGRPKLKVKSKAGLSASIKASIQRDLGVNVCHIYFGEAGKEERIGSDGQKDRPHIVFSSSGYGVYTRLTSYKCLIRTHSDYDRNRKVISASNIHIEIDDWSEALVVNFKVDHAKQETRVMSAKFISI